MLVDQLINLNNSERFYLLKDFSIKNDLHRSIIFDLINKLSEKQTFTEENSHLNYNDFLFINIPFMKSLQRNDYFSISHIDQDYINNPFNNKNIDFCFKKENNFHINTFILDYFYNSGFLKNDLTIYEIYSMFIEKVPFVLESIETQINTLLLDIEKNKSKISYENDSKKFFISRIVADSFDFSNLELKDTVTKNYNDFILSLDNNISLLEEDSSRKLFLANNYSDIFKIYSNHLKNLTQAIKELLEDSFDYSYLDHIKSTILSLKK